MTKNISGYSLKLPTSAISTCDLPPYLIEGLGLKATASYCNNDYLIVFEHEDDIKNMQPNFDLIQQIDLRCIIVTAKSKQKT